MADTCCRKLNEYDICRAVREHGPGTRARVRHWPLTAPTWWQLWQIASISAHFGRQGCAGLPACRILNQGETASMATRGQFASCTLPSIVTRAADVPGAWVAECIPLGVVTQGDSLKHAIDMLAEAVDMVIDDDLQRGVDPLQTRAPLDESSGEFAKLMSHPLTPVDVEAVDASVSIVVVMLKVVRPHVPAMAVSERPSLAKRYESLMAPLQATAC